MKNFEQELKRLWADYKQVPETSNDDDFFANKYGEIGINSRKSFFIWKTNINKLANESEINELEKKYNIKFK